MSCLPKFCQKITAALLAVMLTAVLVVVPAGAAPVQEAPATAGPVSSETPQAPEETGTEGEVAVLEARLGDGLGELGPVAFSSPANASISGSMYGRLTTRQKECYNALQAVTLEQIEASAGRKVEVDIRSMIGIKLQGRLSGGNFQPTGTSLATYNTLQNDLQVAIVALSYDRPDMLWLDGQMYSGFTLKTYTDVYTGVGDGTIQTVYYQFPSVYNYNERTYRTRMLAAAKEIAQEARQQPDTYSQVKAVHDIIAAQCEYEHSPANSIAETMSHCAYSALIGGDAFEPVCDGYSKAMKMVLDELDIPCVLVSSTYTDASGYLTGHMWNNVKMDDGCWYNLDLTWDDGGTQADYDYFLVGTDSRAGGIMFKDQQAHREADPFADVGLTLAGAKYPKKMATDYQYLGHDWPPTRYTDVPRDAWYYSLVERVSELGYFQGDGGKFNPNTSMSRAEFAVVMANIYKVDLEDYAGKKSFDDVGTKAWYHKAAAWAKESGLMRGEMQNGKLVFRPNDRISRQEMCVVLYQALGLHYGGNGITFKDDSKISGWAKEKVYACQEAGLLRGDEKGNFNPLNSTKRSEAASVFSAYADYVGQ
ncbi:S-layer homology domain-containing protein [Acutalibacter caecimuris]|uniref:S-layer homology domain-containing protein n=1 Tax=Acutalibacter caecimuris TaxID=3093657 RepID=UPI002AC94222|nr:S-layer homology domain-containing protein [Acutalibacter sp. M00118]